MELGQTLLHNQERILDAIEQLQIQYKSLQRMVSSLDRAKQYSLDLTSEAPTEQASQPALLQTPEVTERVKIRCKTTTDWSQLDNASKGIYRRNYNKYERDKPIFDEVIELLNQGFSLDSIYDANEEVLSRIGMSQAKSVSNVILSLRQVGVLQHSSGSYVFL